MSALELKKTALAKQVLNIDNEEHVNELAAIMVATDTKPFPCQYSIEELRAGSPAFLEDIKSGNVIAHEDICRK